VEQRPTENSTSPGVTINFEDSTAPVDSAEVQKADWSINPPPIDHPEIELDSAGRVMTPVHPDFIVDWSNKDSSPKAVPRQE
jgi:spore germination protein GerM